MDSEKYRYKLAWLDALRVWVATELAVHRRLAVVGDLNIAPDDRDVHSPQRWAGQVLVSAPERAAFRALLRTGLHDAFRLGVQPERMYSWWPYGAVAYARNWGLRIDHILVSAPLATGWQGCEVEVAPAAMTGRRIAHQSSRPLPTPDRPAPRPERCE